MINRTTFQSNDALRGGSIYLGNQNIAIENSTFGANSATEGGAILSYCEGIR